MKADYSLGENPVSDVSPHPPSAVKTGQFNGHKARVTMMVARQRFLNHNKGIKMQPTSNNLSKKITYIGIDVSNKELVVAYSVERKWKQAKVQNTIDSISSWLESFGVLDKVFVLEHTGTYSDKLIHTLNDHEAQMIVVNPIQSSGMAKSMGKINKTDFEDAKTLATLGERGELPFYKVPSKAHSQLKQVYSAIENFEKQAQRVKNQLHAFSQLANPEPIVIEHLEQEIASLEERSEQLAKYASELMGSKNENETVKNLQTIKGVGKKTAAAIVILFGNISAFSSAKAFAKFIGICPTYYQSGTSINRKGKISKRGNGKIRALLFNCARSAILHDENMKEFYTRLVKKGKNGKVALIAVMHKLTRIIYAVATTGSPYDVCYQNKMKN